MELVNNIFEEIKNQLDIVKVYEDETGYQVISRDEQVQVRCFLPGHVDRNPSCSINREQGVWFCHRCKKSGSVIDLVMATQGFDNPITAVNYLAEKNGIDTDSYQLSELFYEKEEKEYIYTDLEGAPLHKTIRKPDKSFSQQRFANGKWEWGLEDTKLVLYNLPALNKVIKSGETIFIVEGEKDAGLLTKKGLIATTNALGAGKWKESYTNTLIGGNVVIIPDNDLPGKNHAEHIAEKLYNKVQSLKILTLPGLGVKGDVTDWLLQSGTKEELLDLAEKSLPYESEKFNKKIIINNNDFLPTPLARDLIIKENRKGKFYRYVAEKEVFYYYDNKGYWRVINTKYVKKIIRNQLLSYNNKWDKKHYIEEVLEALKNYVLHEVNLNLFNVNIYHENVNINPYNVYINTIQGMFDWQKGIILPYDPNYYSQFQLNVKYDPKKECPLWIESLKQWIPERESHLFLQEFAGYCLIPDTSFHKALFLVGSGSNGKSTFLNVLAALFGTENLFNIPLHRLTDKFETVNIQDKLVNICPDIDPTYLKKTGILKTIIAGESVRGEYKYGPPFSFIPVVRLIFSTNELPMSRDHSEGWYRRFEIIRFPNEFKKSDPKFDPDLEVKLKGEISGIFNWAVEGLRRLKRNGNFTQSNSIIQAKRVYEIENDSVASFIDENTELEPDGYEICSYVYNEYKAYCQEANLSPVKRRKFTSRIKTLGFKSKVTKLYGKSERCYYGFTLKN